MAILAHFPELRMWRVTSMRHKKSNWLVHSSVPHENKSSTVVESRHTTHHPCVTFKLLHTCGGKLHCRSRETKAEGGYWFCRCCALGEMLPDTLPIHLLNAHPPLYLNTSLVHTSQNIYLFFELQSFSACLYYLWKYLHISLHKPIHLSNYSPLLCLSAH